MRFNCLKAKQTWQVRSENERTELKCILIVTLTCCCCVWPDTHTHTHCTLLWVPMPLVKLSNTFHTGSTYPTLSPRGLHWRCPFLRTTPSRTHTYNACTHTHCWTLMPAISLVCRGTRPHAHGGSNYGHVNHWTVLLWGTADIAGSGQEKRPLTDFNLGLMIVVWAVECFAAAILWQMPLLFREKDILWCVKWIYIFYSGEWMKTNRGKGERSTKML